MTKISLAFLSLFVVFTSLIFNISSWIGFYCPWHAETFGYIYIYISGATKIFHILWFPKFLLQPMKTGSIVTWNGLGLDSGLDRNGILFIAYHLL